MVSPHVGPAVRRPATVGLLALVIGMSTAAFGTGRSPADATVRPPTPAGFRAVVVAKAGFAVAIPNAWVDFDYTQAGAQARYHALQLQHPNADLPPDPRSVPGVRLSASDPTGGGMLFVWLAPGASKLPSLQLLQATAARQPGEVRPDVTAATVDGHPAIRQVNPCVVTPPRAAASCAGSESITVIGKRGALVFTLGLALGITRGSDAPATVHLVLSTISLR